MILRNIVYKKEFPNDCLLDLYLPESKVPCPMFLYFHGGSLTVGIRKSKAALFQALSARNIAVAAADYRRFP